MRAVVRVEGEDRTGVEVVARTVVAVPVGPGIPGLPVQQLQLGIVRTGQPRRAAAGLPAVLAAPGFVAGLARRRNRVPAPHALAGLRVVGVHEPADAVFRARHADDDLAVDRERRQRQVVADLVVVHGDVPPQRARLRVERRQVAGDRSGVHHVVEHGDAAIHRRRSDHDHIVGNLRRPAPQRTPGAHVERGHRARRLGHVHHAVHDERRGFEDARRSKLVDPGRLQLRHVLLVDLIELRVALRLVAAGVRQPVRRLALGLDDAVVGNLRECRTPPPRTPANSHRRNDRLHCSAPRRLGEIRHEIGQLRRREPRREARHQALPGLLLEQLEVALAQRVELAGRSRT